MTRLWMALDGKKKAWNLPDRPIVVGSGESAQIKLDQPGLAERHCRIEPAPGGWRVVLLADGGALLLNGRAIREGNLRNGDVVSIGPAELHFEAEEALARPSSASRRAPVDRESGRSRYREEPMERSPGRRRGRAYQGQGLPSWAIVVLGLGGAALAVYLVLQVLGGTLQDVGMVIKEAENMARQGRFAEARELLDGIRATAPAQDQARLTKMIAGFEEQIERKKRETRMRSEFEVLKKFEENPPVRSSRKDYMVYELLYRIDEFRRDNPNLPEDIQAQLREWENRYSAVVDMRAEPMLEWVTPLIRGPVGRSQHYKRFDLPMRRLADFRARHRSQAMQAHLDLLEAELLRNANMFGKREVDDGDALIAQNVSSFPKLNAQIKAIEWMIAHVGLPEWETKGKEALDRLLAHREKMRQIRDGEIKR